MNKLATQCFAKACITILLLTGTLSAYADRDQPLLDGDFEQQRKQAISAPWQTEGSGFKGIDIGKRLASSGKNNAFIRTSAREWNALTQFFNTTPLADYRVEADVRSSGNMRDGYFGIRDEVGRVIKEVKFGPLPQYTRLRFDFAGLPRQTGVKLFIGYWALGEDSWIQIDNVHVGRLRPID